MNSKKIYIVKGVTQVHVPSTEFSDVPYYVYLLEDQQGNRKVWKHSKKYAYNDNLNIEEEKEDSLSISIGVIGAGTTGSGIAAVALSKGCAVTILVRKKKNYVIAHERILHHLVSLAGREKTDHLINNLHITDKLQEFSKTSFIIEAINENRKEKMALYKALERVVDKHIVIATNTSSLSLEALSKALKNPLRFIGMHFFNPVTRMKLVEIMTTKHTNKKTLYITKTLAERLDKFPICLSKQSEGFIVNRLLFSLLAEAIRIEQQGIASKDEIDKAVELGLHHPLGPFKLMDYIGLDISLDILNTLPSINKTNLDLSDLEKKVMKGTLGKKTGKGFYNYNKK